MGFEVAARTADTISWIFLLFQDVNDFLNFGWVETVRILNELVSMVYSIMRAQRAQISNSGSQERSIFVISKRAFEIIEKSVPATGGYGSSHNDRLQYEVQLLSFVKSASPRLCISEYMLTFDRCSLSFGILRQRWWNSGNCRQIDSHRKEAMIYHQSLHQNNLIIWHQDKWIA